GVPFWLAFFAALIVVVMAARQVVIAFAPGKNKVKHATWLANAALVFASIGICVVLFETYFAFLERAAVAPRTEESAVAKVPTEGMPEPRLSGKSDIKDEQTAHPKARPDSLAPQGV